MNRLRVLRSLLLLLGLIMNVGTIYAQPTCECADGEEFVNLICEIDCDISDACCEPSTIPIDPRGLPFLVAAGIGLVLYSLYVKEQGFYKFLYFVGQKLSMKIGHF